MQLKSEKLDVPTDEPFKNDVLGRKESAEILTQLVSNVSGPFVLAVDAPWGTGKTTFIEMWMAHLKEKGFPCLDFNAWENDFSDDPLVSLIGEIGASFTPTDSDKAEKSELEKTYDLIKQLGGVLAEKGMSLAMKVAITKLMGQDVGKLFEDLGAKQIEKYEADKEKITDFKKNLRKFVKELPGGKDKPLIFFIDELDRCRPDFAVELLEKAKHFFDVDGIIFVLSIDKDQMENAVKHLYGSATDSDGYLRRFIDLDYRLPEPDHKAFCDFLCGKFELEKFFEKRASFSHEFKDDRWSNIETFSKLFKIFNFSLRVQEQCFARLNIVIRTTPSDSYLCPILLCTLICLRADNPKLYLGFVNRSRSFKDVLEYIKDKRGGVEFLDKNDGRRLEANLISSACSRMEIREISQSYKQESENEKLSAETRERYEVIASWLGSESREILCEDLSYLTKKIEITEQFV